MNTAPTRIDVTLWADGTVAAHTHDAHDGSDPPMPLNVTDWYLYRSTTGFVPGFVLTAPLGDHEA